MGMLELVGDLYVAILPYAQLKNTEWRTDAKHARRAGVYMYCGIEDVPPPPTKTDNQYIHHHYNMDIEKGPTSTAGISRIRCAT